MKCKIKKARDFINNKDNIYDDDIILKLKEVTDKAELVYNDVKVKRLRSKAAQQTLKELEHELDGLLYEITEDSHQSCSENVKVNK